MMMEVITKSVETFMVQLSSLKGDFLLEIDVTMVNKKQILFLENPRYQQVLERYDHLKGVKMHDMDHYLTRQGRGSVSNVPDTNINGRFRQVVQTLRNWTRRLCNW